MKEEREKIVLKLKNFFKEKAAHYGIDLVFLYGSWAGGYPHSESDIDLAIVFYPTIEQENIFPLITDIAYEVGKGLSREVNIIPVFEDFRKPMLYYNAIVLGEPLLIRDETRYLDLRMSAIVQMEDFSIFGIPWQLEIAERTMRK
jgi:predicted nucleotidyltransferase